MAKRGSGEGSIRKSRGGLRWEARYRDPATGERKSVYGKTRKAAAARLAAKLAGAEDPAPPRGQRLGAYLTGWVAAQAGIEPQTRNVYAGIAKHWITHLGRAPLGGLTPDAVQAAQRAIAEASGVESARKATKILKRALRRPAARGYVRPGLLDDIKMPVRSDGGPRRRVLDDEEVARVRGAAQGSALMEPLVELLLGTGLRIGEALALRWRDVDLVKATLTVERSRVESSKGTIHFKAPKTASGLRGVELPRGVVQALHAHRERLGALPHPDLLVFADRKGGCLRKSNLIRRHWHPLLKRAGFTAKELFGFHALRHTSASHLLARGADVAAVAARLGHRDPSFTYKVYVHALERERERARDVADAWMSAAKQAPALVGVQSGVQTLPAPSRRARRGTARTRTH